MGWASGGITGVADGSVTEAKLADGAVTTVKLADGAATRVKRTADGSKIMPILSCLVDAYRNLNLVPPAGEAELSDGRRLIDLSNSRQARLSADLTNACTAGSFIRMDFSADGGTTWTNGPTVSLAAIGRVTSTTWFNLPAALQIEGCLTRIMHGGGDAVDNYVAEVLFAEFR